MAFDKEKYIDLGIKIGLAYLGYTWISKQMEESSRKNSENQTSDKLEVQLAQQIRTALDPVSWLHISVNGVNRDFLIKLAPQIINLKATAKEYDNMYKESMYQRLQSKLGSEDYKLFLSLLPKNEFNKGVSNNGNAPTRSDIPQNYWIWTEKAVNARKTPEAESSYLPFNNILKTFPPERLIGFTTGKYEFDAENNVLFIEVWAYTQKKEKVFFWVAKSQISLLSIEAKKKKEAAGKKLVYAPLSGVSSLSLINSNKVITKNIATIYNEQLKPCNIAPLNIILGTLKLQMNIAGTHYIQFESPQGLIRWVKKEDIKIDNPV